MLRARSLALIFCLFAILGPRAEAFWLRDHEYITKKAIQNLTQCGLLPSNWAPELEQEIIQANDNEDLNLIRKWTHYSHYYNPNKNIDMVREDSSATVGEALESINTNLARGTLDSDVPQMYSDLGRIIHHLQDASVPAHVVPVSHFLSDGFESLPIQDPGTVDAGLCQQLAQMSVQDPLLTLRETAIRTLDSLSQSFYYSQAGQLQQSTWGQVFWVTDPGPEFGVYGIFGNNFGRSQFKTAKGIPVNVQPEVFDAFKWNLVESAVLATERAFLWLKQMNATRVPRVRY
jgi:hypothetical protein